MPEPRHQPDLFLQGPNRPCDAGTGQVAMLRYVQHPITQ